MFRCYDIPQEDAASIGEPLADTLVEYLPDTWLQSVAKNVDPFQCLFALYFVVQKTMGAEKATVAHYQERLVGQQPQEGPPGRRQEAAQAPPVPEEGEYPETPLGASDEPQEAILRAADPAGVSDMEGIALTARGAQFLRDAGIPAGVE